MKVYEYPNCSTCRSALKFLEEKAIVFERIDITLHPPSKDELKKMVKCVGGDFKKLFNTSGVLYREMKLWEKIGRMDVETAVDLLAKHGKLIKRPFVLLKDGGLLGFREPEWKTAFAS